ncbi:MAG: LarC family nickel insertion protein, partial [Planctomycetota bacterium]|nr:LarC family nickel insertion protein [Planctomycetota bacterium]
MSLAYFDCFSGASGDMILGALLDAGLDFEILQAELSKLNLDEFDLSTEQVLRSSIGGTKFNVILQDQEKPNHHDHDHAGREHDPGHGHRNLGDVKQIIKDSSFSDRVKENSTRIFTRLARAEAKVHRSTIDQVHFHEVGAVDAIVDIVGACIGFEALGIDEIHCSELVTGSGHVHCAHGTMPVPAPATAELIQGVPSRAGNIQKE